VVASEVVLSLGELCVVFEAMVVEDTVVVFVSATAGSVRISVGFSVGSACSTCDSSASKNYHIMSN
jgi:hypothetical protein